MSEDSLYAQASELFHPGRMDLVYRYGHDTCCAEVFFSDGSAWWCFYPSNLMGDALQQLISALVAMLRYDEPFAFARWWNEPQEIRWVLRRDGDLLRIEVVELPDFARAPLASDV